MAQENRGRQGESLSDTRFFEKPLGSPFDLGRRMDGPACAVASLLACRDGAGLLLPLLAAAATEQAHQPLDPPKSAERNVAALAGLQNGPGRFGHKTS